MDEPEFPYDANVVSADANWEGAVTTLEPDSNHVTASGFSVPVYVMLPLDIMDEDGHLRDKDELYALMKGVKEGTGVYGVMVDVWWGQVQRAGPLEYNFNGYVEVVEMARSLGLKVQPIASFHACEHVSLPPWVYDVENEDIFYKDAEGNTMKEYLSWGVDDKALFYGRTAVQLYADFMEVMYSKLLRGNTDIITGVHVGLGPAGELRYPSYRQDSYPNVGAFQCYDVHMLEDLKQHSQRAGYEDGFAPPTNAGSYHSNVHEMEYFNPDGDAGPTYRSAHGKFFLEWYSQRLIDHGARVLAAAKRKIGGMSSSQHKSKHANTRTHNACLLAGASTATPRSRDSV